MTPETLATLTAVATILKTVGTLPFSLILVLIFIGPWVAMAIGNTAIAKRSDAENERINTAIIDQNERANAAIAAQNERVNKAMLDFRDQVTVLVNGQEKRFEAVVRMYENNVQVVKDYHGLATDLTGIITLSTRTLEGLVGRIDNNQFCPLAREGVGKR